MIISDYPSLSANLPTTNAVYRFTEDKLTEVQLVFRSDENAVEQFDSIVAEAIKLFGSESEKVEDTLTVALPAFVLLEYCLTVLHQLV